MENWFEKSFSCTDSNASDQGVQLTNALGHFNNWLELHGADHHVLSVSTIRDGYGRLCLTVKLRKK
jgi:hypothetical protein